MPGSVKKHLGVRLPPTIGPQLAGHLFGLGRNTAYTACRKGHLPALKIGGKYRVPTAKLGAMLGMDAAQLAVAIRYAEIEMIEEDEPAEDAA